MLGLPVRESTVARRAAGWSWRVRPEGWICGLLLVWALLASAASHANLMMLLAALVGGMLMVGATAPLVARRRLKLRIDLPERVFAGQPALVNVELQNPSAWRGVSGKGVRLVLDPPLFGPLERYFWWIPRRGAASWSRTVVFGRRGEYYWQPPVVVNTYPFGFAECAYVPNDHQRRTRVVVYPALGQLNTQFFEQQLGVRLAQVVTTPEQTSREQEFRGLREYREGDSARWIHWPTTARKGQLMVREFEIPQHNRILVVLVPWLPHRVTSEAVQNVELSISLAATTLYELSRRPNTRVALMIAGRPPQAFGQGSEVGSVGVALEALALLRGEPAPDFQAASELLRRLAGPGVHVSLITTAPAQRIAGLEKLLGARGGRGRSLLLDVSDRRQLLSYFVPPPMLLTSTAGGSDEDTAR